MSNGAYDVIVVGGGPGGLFLNHGITRSHAWKRTPQWDFLIDNVFPNAELDHVSHLCETLEGADFEVLDAEGLRPHYALTCRRWAERLRANEHRAIDLVGRRRYRTWLLYLTASSLGFEQRSIGLHQVLVQRPDPEAVAEPATREEIYRGWPRHALRAADRDVGMRRARAG